MSDAVTVNDLCALVEARAGSLGHRLEPWEAPEGGASASRATRCTLCGRVAYVRVEGGLLGAAGEAYFEACPSRA